MVSMELVTAWCFTLLCILLVIMIKLKHGWYGVGYWLVFDVTLHIAGSHDNNGCP